MSRSANDFLQGTLDVLILKTLSHGPLHGYGIARRIEDRTLRALIVEEGSLYPALYRLERRRLIEAEWDVSELGRRAKFYRLTSRGRQRLSSDTKAWTAFAAAVSRVLVEA